MIVAAKTPPRPLPIYPSFSLFSSLSLSLSSFFTLPKTRSRYLFNDIGRRIEGKPTARLLLFKYHGVGILDREFSISNNLFSVETGRI